MVHTSNAESLESSSDKVLHSLCPQEIALDVDLRDKRRALEIASTLVERSLGLDAGPVLRALLRREQAGSTALGTGVAIPHARIPGIERPVIIYLRAKFPIAFDAPNGSRSPTSW